MRGEFAFFFGEEAAVAQGVLKFFGALRDERESGLAQDLVFAGIERAENPKNANEPRENFGLEDAVRFQFPAEPGEKFLIAVLGGGNRRGLHAQNIAGGGGDFVLSLFGKRG